jgi:CheY-like chemotaxis protein
MTNGCEPRCRTILVVEDDVAIRDALSDTLGYEGYSVEVAENGQDALDKLAQLQPPCLILLDLMMPVMNGLEFLAALHERNSDDALVTIPVVMVTAYEHMAREAKGTIGVVKKPIDLDSLLRFVKEYCG